MHQDEQTNDQAHAEWLAQVSAMDDMGDYAEELDAAQFHTAWVAGLVQARFP